MKSSAVSFLVKNNFDFNGLFDRGIGYSRFSKLDELRHLCKQQVTRNFQSTRSFAMLSKTHQKELEDLMDEVEQFVYDPTTSDSLVF